MGFYRGAIYFAVLAGLGPLAGLVGGEHWMPESLEIQGPWRRVAWHHGWLRQRRMTAHTVTYAVMQTNADGSPAQLIDAEKRIVVIPRAFLDTPTPASSAEV